eukprot:Partr_v1_DN27898_c0_g1_i1_m22554
MTYNGCWNHFKYDNLCVVKLILLLLVFIVPDYQTSPFSKVNRVDINTEAVTSRKYQAVIYRIIGNDLPPRHLPKQSLTNLAFILNNEPEFQGSLKIWILNRIVDTQKEQALIRLLKHHRKQFIRIPYKPTAYAQIPFKYSHFNGTDGLYSDLYQREWRPHVQSGAIDEMYHLKNLYVMNNNGARNMALENGRSLAYWILPLDGNSFISQSAWMSISACLSHSSSDTQYFTLPMARLTDNANILADASYYNATEEPQVIFRYDSTWLFKHDMRYGRRPKVEMLWRLGAAGYDPSTYNYHPWELYHLSNVHTQTAMNETSVGTCGWVARLFSGDFKQEVKGGHQTRNYKRSIGIRRHIDILDEGSRPLHLMSIDYELWNEIKYAYWIKGRSLMLRILAACLEIVHDSSVLLIVDTLLFDLTGDDTYAIDATLQFGHIISTSRIISPDVVPMLLDCITILVDSKVLSHRDWLESKLMAFDIHERLIALDKISLTLDQRSILDMAIITSGKFSDTPGIATLSDRVQMRLGDISKSQTGDHFSFIALVRTLQRMNMLSFREQLLELMPEALDRRRIKGILKINDSGSPIERLRRILG